jgi:hypothetical protein
MNEGLIKKLPKNIPPPYVNMRKYCKWADMPENYGPYRPVYNLNIAA